MKYGRTHYGKQRYRCRDCGQTLARAPTPSGNRSGHWSLSTVAPDLHEPEAGERTRGFIGVPEKKGKLRVEMDELWSVVGSKKQKQ